MAGLVPFEPLRDPSPARRPATYRTLITRGPNGIAFCHGMALQISLNTPCDSWLFPSSALTLVDVYMVGKHSISLPSSHFPSSPRGRPSGSLAVLWGDTRGLRVSAACDASNQVCHLAFDSRDKLPPAAPQVCHAHYRESSIVDAGIL